MRETIFKATSLSKQYKSHFALDNVNMEIKRGDIYGFIGENGAGKTTLIRILTGLAAKTDGEISIFGETTEAGLSKQRQRTGSIVESPAIYPEMTAHENLEIQIMICGIPDKGCIDKTLKLVNLTDTGKKKAKHFSLGMKQRLGLGVALLNNPEFLILDEPINGLDPAGIIEFRELLKKLNNEKNMTIIISSHILSELYQLATCYGFIHKGKMLEQINLSELDAKCKKHIQIRVDDCPRAVSIIESVLKTSEYQVYPGNLIKLYDFLDKSGWVTRELVSGGVSVEEITTRGDDLEGYYMRLIGGNGNE